MRPPSTFCLAAVSIQGNPFKRVFRGAGLLAMSRRLGTLRGPLGRAREPLSNHCPGLTCLQRSGWSRCFSLPSHPGETPGSNGDGRRPLPRRSPSSSKALFLLAAHQAIRANKRARCRRMRSTRSKGQFTRPQGLSKSLVGKGRIMGDPRETLWSAGTRPMLKLRRLHVLNDSYDCFVSFHDPQYASKPNGSEGRLQLVWLGRRHMPPAMSAHLELALWKWRRKTRELSGKEPCHLWSLFPVRRPVSSLIPRLVAAGAWRGVGHAGHYSRCSVNKGFFCISLTRRRDETVDAELGVW
ncbi:hypothetical protein V8C26DRAFT_242797 [Trichoderma gracile]